MVKVCGRRGCGHHAISPKYSRFTHTVLMHDLTALNVQVRATCCLQEWTRNQEHSTISEVAADWHKLMIPWHIMRPSSPRDGEQLHLLCSTTYIPLHQSATLGFLPVDCKLLLISCPAEGRTMSWLTFNTRTVV